MAALNTDVVHEPWCWCRCHDEYDPGCPSWCSWCDEGNGVEYDPHDIEWDYDGIYFWGGPEAMTDEEFSKVYKEVFKLNT